jgi:hypothetical protein
MKSLKDNSKKIPINPWRVLVKGIIIFLILNIVFGLIDPSMGRFVLFNHGFIPGYQRLPVLWKPNRHLTGTLYFEREFIDKVDLLFAAHIVSSRPKGANEYRVLIFGDSSVWGTALYASETLAGQINSMKLTTCDGKQVVAYNLGYPDNSTLKDLVIQNYAQRYKPDLSIWLFSMLAFTKANQVDPFIEANASEARSIALKYNLDYDIDLLPTLKKTFWDKTIIGRRQDFSLLIKLYTTAFVSASIGTDDPRARTERELVLENYPTANDKFDNIEPPADLRKYLVLDTLRVANLITEGKIIYVNEPVYISDKSTGKISYNSTYPKWAFDQFRNLISEMADKSQWKFYDFWNIANTDEFSTSIFHLRPSGEAKLAEKIKQAILNQVCQQ